MIHTLNAYQRTIGVLCQKRYPIKRHQLNKIQLIEVLSKLQKMLPDDVLILTRPSIKEEITTTP